MHLTAQFSNAFFTSDFPHRKIQKKWKYFWSLKINSLQRNNMYTLILFEVISRWRWQRFKFSLTKLHERCHGRSTQTERMRYETDNDAQPTITMYSNVHKYEKSDCDIHTHIHRYKTSAQLKPADSKYMKQTRSQSFHSVVIWLQTSEERRVENSKTSVAEKSSKEKKRKIEKLFQLNNFE